MRGGVGDSPLRILYVTAPGPAGGLESVVLGLAAGLSSRGHEITVAAAVAGSGDTHPFVARLRRLGVPVVLTPEGYLAERAALIALARSTGAGVIHSHGYRSDVLIRSARRTLGRPLASTVHGFTGGGPKNRSYERLQVMALRGFAAVFAVSGPLAEGLRQRGVDPARIHLVPNGFAPSTPRLSPSAARARLAPGAEGPLIGWVGRLSREKGCDIFLQALATIRGAPWSACVVGEGPERRRLETMSATLGLAERVTWPGLVEDAAACFTGFTVLALSSRTEGTPMVVLEAMAAGVPVVATAVGGVPDLLSEGPAGWLVAPGDPVAFGAALRAALEEPAVAARYSAQAARALESRYAVAPWLDRYEAVYRGLTGVSSGRVTS
jgi:glycosyltransferase involved in cell wall biosynthesis